MDINSPKEGKTIVITLEEHDNFIKEKSKVLFEKLNEIKLENHFSIEKTLLNGLSNKFYRVELKSDGHKDLKVKELCFKIFGTCCELVDRNIEFSIMENFANMGYGPKVYDTDFKTYRVEEFLHEISTLENKDKHNPIVVEELKKSFLYYNSTGEIENYKSLIGKSKREMFDYLNSQDKNQNVVSLTLHKMGSLAKTKLKPFAKKMRESTQFGSDKEALDILGKIEHYLNNIESMLYEIFPEKTIIGLNHCDSHLLNILVTKNFEKVYLIDHEFGCYSLIGMDIANYNIENIFYLGKETWPFFELCDDLAKLDDDIYYNRFKDYMQYFGREKKEFYREVTDFDGLIEYMSTREYYWRCLAYSGIFWFVWGINYFDFDKFVNKSNFNYFNYVDERLKTYHLAKEIIEKSQHKDN